MTIAEQLLETLHELAPQQQAEVLDFAEFLRRRPSLSASPAAGNADEAGEPSHPPPRNDLLHHLRGSATVRMSTDEIMALTRGE